MAEDRDEKKTPSELRRDEAGGSSSEPEDDGLPEVNERSLLRKIDGTLLPAVGILYLLSFLDRSNGERDVDSRLQTAWKMIC